MGFRPLDLGPKPRHLYNPLDDVATELEDDSETTEEELAAAHAIAESRKVRKELQREDLDQETRDRLTTRLWLWKGIYDRATIDAHWTSGEGDRKLF